MRNVWHRAHRRSPMWWLAQIVLTAVAAALLWKVIAGVGGWFLLQADWLAVADNLRLFAIGRYPAAEAWRPAAVLILVTAVAGFDAVRRGKQGSPRPAVAAASLTLVLVALSWTAIRWPHGAGAESFATIPWEPILLRILLVASAVRWLHDATRPGAALRTLAAGLLFVLIVPVAAPLTLAVNDSLAQLLHAIGGAERPMLAAVASSIAGWFLGYGIRAYAGETARASRALARGAMVAWVAAIPVSLAVLVGGVLPVVEVPPARWGGLLLTLVLAVCSIGLSLPIGVMLALARRSRLPLVRWMAVSYIELIRGVPLVTVLYMTSLLLPLILPTGAWRPGDVAKAVAGLTAFAAAYLAEDVRGGLASVSEGQYDAARAIGLSNAGVYRFVVLPQALRAVVPAIAGQFISLFKDTSLVFIIGLRELLGQAVAVANQPEHIGTFRETLGFIAVIYFAFSSVLSRSSQRLERPSTDHDATTGSAP